MLIFCVAFLSLTKTKYSRIGLIRHRLIRHFFVGPGRIPIFCVHFCSSNSQSSNSSIRSIRHLFRSLRSVFSANPSFAVSVVEFKQIKDLYLRIAAPRNLFIEVMHVVRSATRLPIEKTQKVFEVY